MTLLRLTRSESRSVTLLDPAPRCCWSEELWRRVVRELPSASRLPIDLCEQS